MTDIDRPPLLSARNLTKVYRIRPNLLSVPLSLTAVSDVSFSLFPGQTLAVVGESGCGKSTLARLLTLIEAPSSGSLRFPALERENEIGAGRPLRNNIQIVFQNPYASLNPRHTVGSALEEPLSINTNLSARMRKEAALAMLERVGMRTEHYRRYPHMFSGGQRQRVAIARALMLRPKILVLDEPVSALDVSVRAQILNLLMDMQSEFGLAYIFISHDLAVVRHFADEIAVMYLGRIVEKGPTATLLDNPLHPYTKALISATPQVRPDKRKHRIVLSGELPSPLQPPVGCAFSSRCPNSKDLCRIVSPSPTNLSERVVACHFPAEDSCAVTEPTSRFCRTTSLPPGSTDLCASPIKAHHVKLS